MTKPSDLSRSLETHPDMKDKPAMARLLSWAPTRWPAVPPVSSHRAVAQWPPEGRASPLRKALHTHPHVSRTAPPFVFSCRTLDCFSGGHSTGHSAEEGRSPPGQRVLPAPGDSGTKSGNRSLLPSWLQLGPDSL